jgi:ribonuclease HI
MMAWAVELSQYDISYEPRQAIKAQVLAEFLAEMTHLGDQNPGSWTIYVDGSLNTKGSGAGILVENEEGVAIEYSLKFEFPTSNNQAEYEACLGGIRAAKELGATTITLYSDSQLAVSQIKGDYEAKEPLMQKYLALVKESLMGLSKFEIRHVPRLENSRADLLTKLASTKSASALHSVVEEVIPTPGAVLQIDDEDWRISLKNYIHKGMMFNDQKEAKQVVQKSTQYVVIEGQLFSRGLSTPLLKCIGPLETWYVLAEVHEGSCGHHIGGKSLARKSLRARYF